MELDYMSNSSMILSVYRTDSMGLPLDIIKQSMGYKIDHMAFDPNPNNPNKLVIYLTK